VGRSARSGQRALKAAKGGSFHQRRVKGANRSACAHEGKGASNRKLALCLRQDTSKYIFWNLKVKLKWECRSHPSNEFRTKKYTPLRRPPSYSGSCRWTGFRHRPAKDWPVCREVPYERSRSPLDVAPDGGLLRPSPNFKTAKHKYAGAVLVCLSLGVRPGVPWPASRSLRIVGGLPDLPHAVAPHASHCISTFCSLPATRKHQPFVACRLLENTNHHTISCIYIFTHAVTRCECRLCSWPRRM
jgi:hypothetical protein